jgi:predicted ATPase/transcriptional regulator with XRE-family HTH domain/Tfp pilus assembly protein PilF
LLRAYRRQAGLTQEELAERAELSVRGLRYLEGEARRPHVGTIRRIGDALSLTEVQRSRLVTAAAAGSGWSVLTGGKVDRPELEGDEELPPTNLIDEPTMFIGREREVAAVVKLFQQSQARFVTLTGPGGTGKTRLARQVGATLRPEFWDGVYLVSLDSLGDHTLVPATIAGVLGLREVPGSDLLDTLRRYLETKQLLLILDNFEHLIEASPVVATLLDASRTLRVLVTSRTPLRLLREHEFPVPPMAVPGPEATATLESLARNEAVALFAERAAAVKPGFAVTASNAPAIAGICIRLDGLPLAIELAAARIRVLSPQALLPRLHQSLELLAGGGADRPARHQTLRAAIDWSYQLLEPGEQVLLRRLAVFAGGWTLEAAERVCSGAALAREEVLDRLDGLLQRSLVVAEDRGDAQRFRMLETIRQFAAERLSLSGEDPAVRQRHAEYFTGMAEAAQLQMTGPEAGSATARLQGEIDNLRAALRWTQAANRVALGLQLGASLWRFWSSTGLSAEGLRGLMELLDLEANETVPANVRAGALYAAGCLNYALSEPDRARQLYEDSLHLRRALGDRRGQAEALNGMGVATMDLGMYDQATQWFEESVRLRQETGDRTGSHAPLINLANIARYRGAYSRALHLYEEALVIQEELGFALAVANTLHNLAGVAQDQGDYQHAAELMGRCLDLAREAGSRESLAYVLNSKGAHELEQGQLEQATATLEECLELSRSSGDSLTEAAALVNLAEIALSQGDLSRAETLAERALAMSHQRGHQRGQAFALCTLSDAARRSGDFERAARRLAAYVELQEGMGDALGQVVTLELQARLAASRGEHQNAVRYYSTADARRVRMGTPLPPLYRPEQAQTLADLRDRLGADTFEELWEQGREAAAAGDTVSFETADGPTRD